MMDGQPVMMRGIQGGSAPAQAMQAAGPPPQPAVRSPMTYSNSNILSSHGIMHVSMGSSRTPPWQNPVKWSPSFGPSGPRTPSPSHQGQKAGAGRQRQGPTRSLSPQRTPPNDQGMTRSNSVHSSPSPISLVDAARQFDSGTQFPTVQLFPVAPASPLSIPVGSAPPAIPIPHGPPTPQHHQFPPPPTPLHHHHQQQQQQQQHDRHQFPPRQQFPPPPAPHPPLIDKKNATLPSPGSSMPWSVEVALGDAATNYTTITPVQQPPLGTSASAHSSNIAEKVVTVTHEVPCEKIVHVVVDKVVVEDNPVHVENTVIKEVEKLVEVPIERVVWTEIEVPVDQIVKEEVPVYVEQVTQEIKVVERIKEVPVDKIVVQEVEKIRVVEVEKIVEKEVIKEVPVDKIVIKEVPIYVDKIVEKEVPVTVEKIVENIVVREVPVTKEVPVDRIIVQDKIVEKIVEREKIVEVPVDRVVKNEVPVYVSAELHKTGEVQHFQPVYIDRVVEKDVPVFVDKIIPSEKAVPVVNEVQVLVDRIVEVPVEKIVREYVEVPTDVVVKHEVPITVQNVSEVLVTRDVVREVHTDKVVKEQVPFPNDRVINRVVEVEVETLVDNPVEVLIDRVVTEERVVVDQETAEENAALKSRLESLLQEMRELKAMMACPGDLRLVSSDTASATLEWDPVTWAVMYQVECTLVDQMQVGGLAPPTNSSWRRIFHGAANQCTCWDLDHDKAYWFRVRCELEGRLVGQWGPALFVALENFREVTRAETVRRMDMARVVETQESFHGNGSRRMVDEWQGGQGGHGRQGGTAAATQGSMFAQGDKIEWNDGILGRNKYDVKQDEAGGGHTLAWQSNSGDAQREGAPWGQESGGGRDTGRIQGAC